MAANKDNIFNDIEENQITGYIKLYRSLKKHWLWKASKVKSKAEAFISMVMDANHQTMKEPIGFDLITIKRGQILTSQEKLSIEWRWNRNQVRSFLEMLKADGMIKIETTTKYTMITLCKYESYQCQLPTKQQQSTNKPPTGQQQQDTNNNDNNYNNDNSIEVEGGKPPAPNKNKKLEERKADFSESLKEHLDTYGRDLLNGFYKYWTEKNSTGKKMRFELEKTWETHLRLATWATRDREFTGKNKTDDQAEKEKQLMKSIGL